MTLQNDWSRVQSNLLLIYNLVMLCVFLRFSSQDLILKAGQVFSLYPRSAGASACAIWPPVLTSIICSIAAAIPIV